MSEWGFGFAFDMELDTPLDFFDVGYKNGEKVRYDKRPHGEWVYKKFDEKTGISDSYFCSHCNFPLTGIYKFYCAVCGADMRIKKEGEKE